MMASYLVLEQHCEHDSVGPHVYATVSNSGAGERRCPGGIIRRFAEDIQLELPRASGETNFLCLVEDVITALRFVPIEDVATAKDTADAD